MFVGVGGKAPDAGRCKKRSWGTCQGPEPQLKENHNLKKIRLDGAVTCGCGCARECPSMRQLDSKPWMQKKRPHPVSEVSGINEWEELPHAAKEVPPGLECGTKLNSCENAQQKAEAGRREDLVS